MATYHDTLYLFGDHTGNTLKSIQNASKLVPQSSALSGLFQRCIDRLHRKITNAQLPGYERYLYKQSPLELALATISKDDQSSAIATALLCISQLADVVIYLEAFPRALETKPACRNIMVGTCTGLVTAAAVSCCRNLTEVLSIADDVVEIAFNIGLEAEKRSSFLELLLLPVEQPYTWATLVTTTDVSGALRAIDNLDVPSHARLYASTVGRSTLTVSGPPSNMGRLFGQGGFLENCEKTSLPIMAAFHAQHLDPTSWDQLIGDASPTLLSMSVEHPFVVSSSSGEFFQSNTFIDLLMRVCEDIMQRPIALEAITQGLERSVTGQASCLSFGPESIAHSIRPLLTTHIRHLPQAQQSESSYASAETGLGSPRAMPTAPLADPRDIAIIGMGIRLPGSETLEEFWSVLENGCDLHERVPADRFDLSTHFDPSGAKPNTTRTPYGVFLERPGYFDRHLFKMSPREARQTDPQQRLLLLATYEALEMAGYSPDGSAGAYPGRRVGSFIGQTSDDWREVNASQDIDTYFIPGGMRAFGPGKLHYHFGWDGPSYSIDTACSGSAAAIQLAVSSLLSKECDMAIGGGVNLLTAPDLFAGLCRGGFLSSTGGCNTFDDAADGYCRADAIGVVVLKRLSDAIMDRDVVHAVLRGALTNHSAEAVSITHPHAETQERLFSTLLTKLNLTPEDINYVEMHGTGTQAGDATEMLSVTNVLARGHRTSANPLYVGSVKPNLGHGEAGSGVTSLIKAVMMLRKSIIPPHIGIKSHINRKLPNMAELHTHLSQGNTPFLPRPGRNEPRRILVNNFDAAGGNTSMVIQDPPPLVIEGVDPRPYHIITISGKTLNSTHENTKRLLTYIKKHPETRLEDIAYTTTARRIHHHAYRQAYAVSSLNELSRSLEQTIEGKDSTCRIVHHTTVTPPFVVFAFTGQGCQYASMAQELFDIHPPFRDFLESMAQICVSHGFASFLPLIADPENDLARASPVQIQTAIVAIELAMVNFWKDIGVTPDAVIGHSLGEFAALCTAGVISVSTCLYLVGRRAMLMEDQCAAGTHAMLVVHESPQVIEKYLVSMSQRDLRNKQDFASYNGSHICEIACVNSIKSTVVSGPSRKIESLQQQLISSGVKASLLKVPFAFHSSQIDAILDDYEAEAGKVSFMPPRIPIASTTLGTLVTDQGIIDAGYLRQQTRGSVKFSQAVNALRYDPNFPNSKRWVWVEVGPDAHCTSLTRANLEQSIGRDDLFLPSMRRGKGDWEVLAGAVVAAYKAGMSIDWRRYHKPFERALQLLELPSYAFDLQNYWIQYEGDWSATKGRLGGVTHTSADTSTRQPASPPGLYRIQSEVIDAKEVSVTFTSEVSDPRLHDMVHGHRVNGNSLYSSALYAEMAYTAARYTQSLANPGAKSTLCMDLRDMEVSEPLLAEGEDSKRLVLVTVRQERGSNTVQIQFCSQLGSNRKDHAKCVIVFGDGDMWQSEWRQSTSLVQARIDHLAASSLTGPTHRILGPMVYKLFSTFVDYDEPYRGIEEVCLDSRMQEASAKVRFATEANDLFVYHPCWIDSLAHISGFVLNGSDTTPSDTVYISHGWKSMKIAVAELSARKTYHTYVRMKEDPKVSSVMIGDVYVVEDGHIIALVQDIKFRRIKRFQLEHFLPLKRHHGWNSEMFSGLVQPLNCDAQTEPLQIRPAIGQSTQQNEVRNGHAQLSEIDAVFDVIAREVGVQIGELEDHALLADTGIDSLLSLSIAARAKDILRLEIPSSLFLNSVSFGDLRGCLINYYGLGSSSSRGDETEARVTTSNANEIPCNGSQWVQNGSIKTSIELVARSHLLWRSNLGFAEERILFLFPDGAGRASSYTWLSAANSGVASVDAIYGLDSPFAGDNVAAFDDVSLNDAVGSYIRAIRAVQPHGPYHLGGWSIGGVLAFEAASQLQDVSSLFLIDPPCPKVLEEGFGGDRAVHGFETAQQIIEIATLVHGTQNGVKPPAPIHRADNDTMQAHFVGSMQMLERYRPLPLHKPGLRTTLLWAKKGVLETLGPEAVNGYSNGANAASNWVLEPRQGYGPNGWNMLLPETSIECCVIDGDHFSIMKNPAVADVGKMLERSFALLG